MLMSTMRCPLVLLALLFLLPVRVAQAQALPDAGTLLQQIEKERPVSVPKTGPAPVAPAASAATVSGPTVTVATFRFTGNTLLGNDVLANSVAGFLNRPLDFAELQHAVGAVAEVYRKAGWIVRADLPAQDIQGGIVTIQIVEAVLGAVRVEGEPPRRIDPRRLQAIVEGAQPKGAPLNGDALDRALLLINDVPGVRGKASLTQGQGNNETDLLLSFAEPPLVQGEIVVDNTGPRSTGAQRLGGTVVLDSPLHWGDQWRTQLVHSEGSDYLRLGFALPIGSGGWRMGASVSGLHYKLVAPEFASLDGHGTSLNTGLEASYALIRSRSKNLFVSLAWDHDRFHNELSSRTASDYKIDAVSASLNGYFTDEWGAGGVNVASLTLMQGKVDLAGSPNEVADAGSTQTAGGFTLVRYVASREQFFSDNVSLFGSLTGQLAGKNLDSAEKFSLGGAGGVRAYPSGEGSGSEGQVINLELRARLRDAFTMAGFYDYGQVTVNSNNDFTTGPALINRYSLKGAGVSVGWTSAFGLNLKAIFARRIGANPNPTVVGGNDQDGSLTKNRWWVRASLAF